MKTPDAKPLRKLDTTIYCAHCYIRVGVGEKYRVREGKAYHSSCYAKVNEAVHAGRRVA